MPTRTITVPDSIVVRLGKEEVTIAFADFINNLMANSSWSEGGYKAAKAQASIAKSDWKPGEKVALAEADWKLLVECVERPNHLGAKGMGYNPTIVWQLVPFMDTVVSAPES